MIATALALLQSLVEAFVAYQKTADIRERRELRNELKNLRAEIRSAADVGRTDIVSELENELVECERDCKTLQPAPKRPAA